MGREIEQEGEGGRRRERACMQNKGVGKMGKKIDLSPQVAV